MLNVDLLFSPELLEKRTTLSTLYQKLRSSHINHEFSYWITHKNQREQIPKRGYFNRRFLSLHLGMEGFTQVIEAGPGF